MGKARQAAKTEIEKLKVCVCVFLIVARDRSKDIHVPTHGCTHTYTDARHDV